MRKLFLSLLLLSSFAPVQAQENINKAAHISALVHCERAPRSKKLLCLLPGKIKQYHYEWIMPDGSTATKVVPEKMPGVYDRRELRESHPNLAIALPVLQQLFLGGLNITNLIR